MRIRLLPIFIAVPLIETYVLIQVGSVIGALPTIALVILSAVVGSALLRIQGVATLARIRQSLDQGRVPAVELIEGGVLLVAGVLLITPGFFTDTAGLLCMIPPLRRRFATHLLKRLARDRSGPGGPGGPGTSQGTGRRTGSTTLEGDYRRED